jgi:spermidine synthase
MPAFLAALVVFVCSGAVLMLEIVAGRVLAPYVGVSLNTYTAIIGTVLAAIALGAWGGGKVADRVDPRRMLGPLMMIAGVTTLLTVPIVRAVGPTGPTAGSVGSVVVIAVAGFFLPAVVLSAVHPMVAKLQLRDLGQTGGVVGWLSGVGTFGALVGTFVTGFLLVATVPTRTLIYCIGGFLVVAGAALWWWLARCGIRTILGVLLLAGIEGIATASTREPCDRESAYFCIRVEKSPFQKAGRTLWLDNGEHSYVDLDDPTHLEFDYVRSFANVVGVAYPEQQVIDVVHVGGGGFTFPRYLDATRPGSRNTVYELDRAVFDTARQELGLRPSRNLKVRIGDGRLLIRRRASNSVDVVVGDAFNSLSVPWHLTTREFIADIDRVLRPEGVYVMNIIDEPPFRFARAELATLQDRFGYVALIADSAELTGTFGGNLVLVASHRALDHRTLVEASKEQFENVARGRALRRFVARAQALTDDFAPVDQWLARNDN